jgi:predicted porin
MKKSLFAAAAASAFAGASGVAHAQSSVTVYGVLDMGYVNSAIRAVDGTNTSTVPNNKVVKTNTSAIAAGAESTSRLGFRGNEDLGGGKSAFFTVEIGLTPADSNASGANATSTTDAIQGTTNAGGSAINNRQSFVGLRDNDLGQIALGRQYTVIYNEALKTDPNGFSNIAGGLIYVATPSQAVQGSGIQANSGFTNRASNSLTFSTKNFSGFNLNGFYALNNADSTERSTSAGGNANWNGWGINGNFTWQKLYATVAYQSFSVKVDQALNYGTVTQNLGSGVLAGQQAGSSSTVNAYSNLADKQFFAGATYDFGILKAYVQYINRNVDQSNPNNSTTVNTGNVVRRSATAIGVRSYVTKTVEVWASGATGSYTGATVTASNVTPKTNINAYQVGANYWLSKRTNMYGMFGTNTSSSNNSLAGAGTSVSQAAIGVRHTF